MFIISCFYFYVLFLLLPARACQGNKSGHFKFFFFRFCCCRRLLAKVEVFFILAKGYLSHELGMLGFPAYDRSQLLLGFYKEVQSQAGQTQVSAGHPDEVTCALQLFCGLRFCCC